MAVDESVELVVLLGNMVPSGACKVTISRKSPKIDTGIISIRINMCQGRLRLILLVRLTYLKRVIQWISEYEKYLTLFPLLHIEAICTAHVVKLEYLVYQSGTRCGAASEG